MSVLDGIRSPRFVFTHGHHSPIPNTWEPSLRPRTAPQSVIIKATVTYLKQLWEWKKPELERIIDEMVYGYLNGAARVTITKNPHLEYVDSAWSSLLCRRIDYVLSVSFDLWEWELPSRLVD